MNVDEIFGRLKQIVSLARCLFDEGWNVDFTRYFELFDSSGYGDEDASSAVVGVSVHYHRGVPQLIVLESCPGEGEEWQGVGGVARGGPGGELKLSHQSDVPLLTKVGVVQHKSSDGKVGKF